MEKKQSTSKRKSVGTWTFSKARSDAIKKWTEEVNAEWQTLLAEGTRCQFDFWNFLEGFVYDKLQDGVYDPTKSGDAWLDSEYYVRLSSTCCGVSELSNLDNLDPEEARVLVESILDSAPMNHYVMYFMPISTELFGDDEYKRFSHLPNVLESMGFKKLMHFKNGNTDNWVVGFGIATPTHRYDNAG